MSVKQSWNRFDRIGPVEMLRLVSHHWFLSVANFLINMSLFPIQSSLIVNFHIFIQETDRSLKKAMFYSRKIKSTLPYLGTLYFIKLFLKIKLNLKYYSARNARFPSNQEVLQRDFTSDYFFIRKKFCEFADFYRFRKLFRSVDHRLDRTGSVQLCCEQ